MLTSRHLGAIIEFMKRVQLNGQEAPYFCECVAMIGQERQAREQQEATVLDVPIASTDSNPVGGEADQGR